MQRDKQTTVFFVGVAILFGFFCVGYHAGKKLAYAENSATSQPMEVQLMHAQDQHDASQRMG